MWGELGQELWSSAEGGSQPAWGQPMGHRYLLPLLPLPPDSCPTAHKLSVAKPGAEPRTPVHMWRRPAILRARDAV